MTFHLRDHTADVAVEATAPTLSGVFEAVAAGLTAASCDAVSESGGDRFAVEERAESREALLFDYLDRLIYERDVQLVLPTDHECAVEHDPEGFGSEEEDGDGADGKGEGNGGEDGEGNDGEPWRVGATARGVPLGDVAAREVKAVTYSEMELTEREDGWYAYVVFDV